MSKHLLIGLNVAGILCSGFALIVALKNGDSFNVAFNMFFLALNSYFLVQNLGR